MKCRFPSVLALAVTLVLAAGPVFGAPSPRSTPASRLAGLPLERPDDPPGRPATATARAATSSTITFGRFTHVQVNVNGAGANIIGDAANEPSLTVDPTNHDRMAIGWRQFDTVTSNFRQAGYGWTTNGGLTWTTGKIEPGVFRSDPVLDTDAGGTFFYNSLTSTSVITTQVFPSVTHGATWGASAFAYGGDKQWMTVDRTGGPGSGRMYQAWSTAGNSYAPNTFNRSIDGGTSFQPPSFAASDLVWGTLAVASDGTLYVVGTDGPGGTVFVARSFDARSSVSAPVFDLQVIDLGGDITTGGPNPAGLCGQLWIGVDRSGGARDGWIYVLASVVTADDPLDVMFTRSTDGGLTWSPPVRVNDDAPSGRAWQWFGTMSVAPNGRIDAIWNDSRLTGDSTKTALYYASSFDGGATWTANEQASAVWTSTVGFPNQPKIGDYYQMISDDTGADLAWAATFNGGEDVFYTRLTPATAAVEPATAPQASSLTASPNPFARSTTLRFAVPGAGARVRLAIFDAAGRRLATLVDGDVPGGWRTARWDGRQDDGREAAPGLYFCRYEAGSVTSTGRLLRLR